MSYDDWKTADDTVLDWDREHQYHVRFTQLLDAGLSEAEADKIARDCAYGEA
jgi:hypothetical protein